MLFWEVIMAKYKTSVYIETYASKHIGEVEFNSVEEYFEKAEKLWESQNYDSPTLNCHNNFDLGDDWDISKISENDLKLMEHKKR
jgi:dTDP-4-dehydrorhamnose 3,5-epimerase-like enzyme